MPLNSYFQGGASPYGGGGLLAPQGGGGFTGFSPLTQFGLGLLSQSGPSLTPQSPWSAIGKAGAYASEAQQMAYQNELIRAKMAEAKTEAAQKKALTDFITSDDFEPPPGMGRQTAGMLAMTSPTEFAKAYVTTPQDALARAQLADLEVKRKEDFSLKERAVASTFAGAGQMASALEGLEGKILEPGAPGVKLARDVTAGLTGVADMIGYTGPGVENLKAQVVDFDTLNKLSAGLVQQLVQNLPGTRVGANTMSLVGQATTGAGVSVGANRRILISTLKDSIQAAKDLGYKVDIAGAEKLISALEKSTVGGATPLEKDVPQIGAARELDQGGPAAAGQEYPPFAEPAAAPAPAAAPGVLPVQTVPMPPASPQDLPATVSPFDQNSAYVMQGPGVGSTVSDLFNQTGIPQGYASYAPYVSEAAAPYIQQGSKAVAQGAEAAKGAARQAIISGKDIMTFAGRKIGEVDASGAVAVIRNASDKAWLRSKSATAKAYLRKLYEAGVREIK